MPPEPQPAPSLPWPNLVAMLFAQAERFGEAPLLWSKHHGAYRSLNWRQVAEQVCRLATGLRRLGLGAGDRVVLVAENRPEWFVADFAVMAIGGITVPAYVTNTEDDHLYLFTHSGARGVIVSGGKLLQPVMSAARAAQVAVVISMEAPPVDAGPPLTLPRLLAWTDVIAAGETPGGDPGEMAIGEADRQHLVEAAAKIGRDQLACLIYTSGTGGAPKGVMLHHGAILQNCAGALAVLRELGGGGSDEVFLSLLPLSHAYEHTVGQCLPVAIGAQIYYAESIDKVLANIQEARPTIVSAVPRFFELIYQRILHGGRKAPPRQQRLFRLALDLGRRRYHQNGRLSAIDRIRDLVADATVRRSVRARFGGRLRVMVSGGAPLNLEVAIALRALGLPVFQGYGQTEAAPLISVNHPHRLKLHTVGPPVQGVEARIAADGELLVRGQMVMQGYWQNPEATSEALRDGWLHTGDIGQIDEDGDITITDRKKDIIVTSGGDNISPARIEGLLSIRPEISQAVVYGDKRPHLVALVVPDPEWMKHWAAAHAQPVGSGLAENAAFHQAVGQAIEAVNGQLSVVERIRRFRIADEPFSVENGQLTSTMKVRRHVVRSVYGERLDSLYEPR
ncbi:MAG: long-chain fatty acid--CoA ligase [Rhodospirillales bacterium]